MIEYTVKVYSDGRTEWFNANGEYHREDGPAIEYSNGDKEWWVNGKYHRENGPACEYNDGTKYWYFNGKRHREDGPAIEFNDGTREWWLEGIEYTEDEFNQETNPVKEMTVKEISDKLGCEIKIIK